VDVYERDGAELPHLAHQENHHLIRNIKGVDQDLFARFQFGRKGGKRLSQFFVAWIIHRMRRAPAQKERSWFTLPPFRPPPPTARNRCETRLPRSHARRK